MWSAVVFDPARPARSSPDRASRVLSRKQNSGWWPKVFSRCGSPIPSPSGRSRSTRPGPGPGRGSADRPRRPPAAHRGYRPPAPRPVLVPVRGPSAAGPTLHYPSPTVVAMRWDLRPSRRTGPLDPAAPPDPRSLRHHQRSSLPGPLRPGPARGRPCRCRNPARASPNAPVKPVASATSASRRAPACPTTPRSSALTVILERVPVAFTWQVPSVTGDQGLRQARSSQIRRHFLIFNHETRQPLTKGPG